MNWNIYTHIFSALTVTLYLSLNFPFWFRHTKSYTYTPFISTAKFFNLHNYIKPHNVWKTIASAYQILADLWALSCLSHSTIYSDYLYTRTRVWNQVSFNEDFACIYTTLEQMRERYTPNKNEEVDLYTKIKLNFLQNTSPRKTPIQHRQHTNKIHISFISTLDKKPLGVKRFFSILVSSTITHSLSTLQAQKEPL